ncbi:hypothetical protein [Variovorax sp. JS1663]|uniref:hypothetical protein n=1 Tax=Variovorax sp. JS1663 TaxID=1851577 RepID=UPI000B6C9C3F|nr:hypothetical protein [Variovorax sp. JS1663]OUM02929.1 hypothetical protein A8M77_08275 [Variovorax sp. JS1663]
MQQVHAMAAPAQHAHGPARAHLTKADLGAQLARRADEWVRHAEPGDLLHVLLCGGFGPVIEEEGGRVRTGIELGGAPGPLSRIGIIWSDLPPTETLPIVAMVWEATPPPADSRLWEAWLALDGHAREGARRFLHDEIGQNITLFEVCAEAWLREN